MTAHAGRGDSRPIAFIDFEASGLGVLSWPVEVGWAFLSGACEAHLIRPDDAWPMAAWDPAAERLHGISVDQLQRAGEAADGVCVRMNEALAASRVYSDAPDWDAFWLYRLFSAARRRPAFELLDFSDLIAASTPEEARAYYLRAERTAPRRHRARDDALHLRAVYRFSIGERSP